MDKSLDDIISSKPKGARGGRAPRRGSARRPARAQILGQPAPGPAQRARVAASVTQEGVKAVTQISEKIIVSNLPADVNEANIKDFFIQTVGSVQNLSLSYDAQGRSKGVATVIFSKKGDAQKAFKEYNNRLIDGKRPMKIEIVVDPSRPLPLVSRVAPAANTATNTASANGGPVRTATRGVRRKGGRGGARKSERPAKTAADLDAEMEDYTSNNAPAVTAA